MAEEGTGGLLSKDPSFRAACKARQAYEAAYHLPFILVLILAIRRFWGEYGIGNGKGKGWKELGYLTK